MRYGIKILKCMTKHSKVFIRLSKRFRKKYKKAQDRFHDDLKQARIIRKKCRLVKRKRY